MVESESEILTQLVNALTKGDVDSIAAIITADPAIVTTRVRFAQHRAWLPKGDYPILHVAAASGSQRAAELMLDAGASVNTTDGFGLTALYYAARYEKGAVAELLLARGASPDGVDLAPSAAEHVAPRARRRPVPTPLLASATI